MPSAGVPVLVTGAAGFIGYHVCRRLLDAGVRVWGVDDLNPYYDPRLKRDRIALLAASPGFTFAEIDIADQAALDAVADAAAPEAVIHLAAQAGVRYSLEAPHAYGRANLTGFLNMLETCRRRAVGHLVYASSSSVYGATTATPFSEHAGANHPVSLYAATKRANELMAHTYAHLFGLPTTGLRFFTVYGPWGRPDMAYFAFTKALFAGEPITLFDAQRMRRDFTYIDDIVDAVVRLVDLPPAPDPSFDPAHPDPARSTAPWRIFNIGNHTPIALTDFVAALEKAAGRTAIIRHAPAPPGDVPETFADVSDLTTAVGFAPKTTLADGLAQFVGWYKNYFQIVD
ncbi:MAG: NAD-dependent epimerase/dehydratase family protein [Alphaproteobacteria bacterium]|nr:NAD-dependent epimerase/dehydratase family protein [Alphaproteobacteria bacterium]